MKKLILILLPLSILAIACSPAQNQTEATSPAQTETAQNKQESTTTIKLVSPDFQEKIPMGDAEIVLEVVDSATGKPIKVESLDVSATMPMEDMEDMIGKVEVQPFSKPGRFKATTYLGMQGTWNVVASVKDPQYQGQQEFTFEVK